MGHPSVTVLTDPRIEFYICFCFFFLAGLPEWKDPLCFLVVFSLSILVAGKPVAEIYFFSNSCRFDIVVVRYCSVKSISPIRTYLDALAFLFQPTHFCDSSFYIFLT